MLHSRFLLLGCAFATITACADPAGPVPSPSPSPVPTTSEPFLSLAGVLEMTDDDPARFGLRLGNNLVLLVYAITEELEAAVGLNVHVTGRFNDRGEFVVASFEFSDGKALYARSAAAAKRP